MTDIGEQAARVVKHHLRNYTLPANFSQPLQTTFDDVAARGGAMIAEALADAGLLVDTNKHTTSPDTENPQQQAENIVARTVPTRDEIAKIIHPGYGRPRYDTETCASCEKAGEIADAVLALLTDQPTVAEVKAQPPELRIEWKRGPLPPRPETTPVQVRATCRHCDTVTISEITGPGPHNPQTLLKCDCQQIRDEK